MELIKNISADGCEFIMSGKFTFSDSQIFREIIDFIRVENNHSVVLNLSGVDFVDSAALGMLLLARDESANNSKRLAIKCLNGQPKKMFDVSKLTEIFNLI